MEISGGFFTAVKEWGENCTNSDECFDHRMVCVLDANNVTRCLCNRFHAWNESAEQCIQIYSAAYIMNQTVTVHDNKAKLEKLQDLLFRGPVYSIYFMIFVIATCTLSVIIYCLYVRAKDSQLRNIIFQMATENEALKRRRTIRQDPTSQC